VPKKVKINENKIGTASEFSGRQPPGTGVKNVSQQRSTKSKSPKPAKTPGHVRKSATAGRKKKIEKKDVSTQPRPVPVLEPSDQEIRMRAYFIAERRHRLGLVGDSNSDWLVAKRQLLSELGPH
jgi:hypothetical protein